MESENGVIRYVTAADLPALEWEGEYSKYRKVYQEVYRQYLAGKSLLWVAELKGEGIIGQIFAQLNSENEMFADGHVRAYLFSFRVKPVYQNQGWGTKLLTHAEGDLRGRGFEVACLNVSKSNEAALKFYINRGYRITGEDKGEWTYIDHNGEKQTVADPSWRLEKGLKQNKNPG